MGSDGQVDIQIHYNLPAALGEQAFHVTLKNAKNVRVERQVKQVAGKGTLSFRFHVPQDMEPQILSVAAFVGKDYTTHLLHRTAGPIEWNQDGSLK